MHIGNLIRQKMEERHKTVVWLAKELSYSRTNVYKIYDKSSIDTDVLLRISAILEYDFFELYSNEVEMKWNRNE
ncbi:helix-turn-helix domain-containing protein [Bacteroides sp.]